MGTENKQGNQPAVQKKVYYIEVLRALATIAVAVLHVASNNWYGYYGSHAWIVFTVYAGLMKFCVPVFFMISGALFLRKEKEISIKRLYTHNIWRLIVFLLVWSFVYQLYQLLIVDGIRDYSKVLKTAVQNIGLGNTQVHFWFVYAIIGLYVLVPVLQIFTKHAQKRQVRYALALCFVFASVLPFLQSFPVFAPVSNNLSKLNVQAVCGYVGFFLLGHYFHSYEQSWRERNGWYLAGIIGLITSIMATCYLCITNNAVVETCFSYTFPGIVCFSGAVYVWVQSHESWFQKAAVSKAVGVLSNCSLGIYAVHMLVLFLLWRNNITTFSFAAEASVPVLALAILLCSLLVAWVLSKIPVVNKFLV